MLFHLDGEHRPLAYKLLASLVVPRPIALVTTIDREGRVNAAPFSFFNAFGSKPPIVGFAPGDREPGIPKDTARNIRETGQFVVNLVDESIAQAMSDCSAELPHGQSELEHAGLTPVPCHASKAPRIAEAPVSLECREWGTLRIGQNRLVIGIVDHLHAREGVIAPATNRVVPENFPAIGRMHGADGYCHTRDFFKIDRPG